MNKKFIKFSLMNFIAFVAMGMIISACSEDSVKPETIIDAQNQARAAELEAIQAIKQDSLNFLMYLDSASYAQEVDSLRRIDSMSRAEDSVALVTGGGYMSYVVQIMNLSTSVAGGSSSRVSETEGVGGAVVAVSMYGVTMSQTTDDSGIATFPSMVQGTLSGAVTVADHTDASWVAILDVVDEFLFIASESTQEVVVVDGSGATPVGTVVAGNSPIAAGSTSGANTEGFILLPNGEVIVDPGTPLQASHAIPVFATTANMGNITGYVTAQTDLTNTSYEWAPAGTAVQAYIDVNSDEFADLFQQAVEIGVDIGGTVIPDPPGGASEWPTNGVVRVIGWSYEDALWSTTVDTAGHYSLAVPAAIQGLPIALKCPNFRADQTLWEGSSIGTVDRVFGFEIEPAGLSTSALTYSLTTGAGLKIDSIRFDMSSKAKGVQLVDAGSGYVNDTVFWSESGAKGYGLTSGGKLTSLVLTDSGMGVTGTPVIDLCEFSDSAVATVPLTKAIATTTNGITGFQVVHPGNDYDSTAPFVVFRTPDIPGGTVPTAVARVNAQGTVDSISVTLKGGGYETNPLDTVTCGDSTDYALDFSINQGSGATVDVYMHDDTVSSGGVDRLAIFVDSVIVTAGGSGYAQAPVIDLAAIIDAAWTAAAPSAQVEAKPGAGFANDVIDVDDRFAPTLSGQNLFNNLEANDVLATMPALVLETTFFPGQLSSVSLDTIALLNVNKGQIIGDLQGNGGVGADDDSTIVKVTMQDGGNGGLIDGQVLSITVVGGGDYWCGTPLLDFDDMGTGSGLAVGSFVMDAGAGSLGSDTILSVPIVSAGQGYVTGDFGNGITGAVKIQADRSNLVTDDATVVAFFDGLVVAGVGVSDPGSYSIIPSVTFPAPAAAAVDPNAATATGTAIMLGSQVVSVEITDPGRGYVLGELPLDLTFLAGCGGEGDLFTTGSGIFSIEVDQTAANSNYCSTPVVSISSVDGKGGGATADAIVMDGMIIGFNVTNAGAGYLDNDITNIIVDILGDDLSETPVSDGEFDKSGSAVWATVGADGIITDVAVVDGGGSHFDPACPPVLSVDGPSSDNGIKDATFTVAIDALGQLDSVVVTFGGHGYPGQNYPASGEGAEVYGELVEDGSDNNDKGVITMPNMDRHIDFYLGTGADITADYTSGE